MLARQYFLLLVRIFILFYLLSHRVQRLFTISINVESSEYNLLKRKMNSVLLKWPASWPVHF